MLKSLQGCRGIAALLVVLYHTSNGIFDPAHYFGPRPFGTAFDFGYLGVDLFFVLSGFIILRAHGSEIGQPRAIGAYLWKRLSRIYPAYWIVLAMLIPAYLMVPSFGSGNERRLDVILSSILLYPHPDNLFVLGVAWSLVYEVLFYLLFGLLILNRRLGVAIFVLWACGILCYPWIDGNHRGFLFNAMHLRFLAGMLIGVALQRWELPRPRLVASIGLAMFMVAALVEIWDGALSYWMRAIILTLASALLVAGLAQAERLDTLPSTPGWFVYLGDASYSIYLIHYPALGMIAKSCKGLHLDAYVPLSALFTLHVIGAVAAGCVFYHLVEKPAYVWSRRFFRRAKPAADVSAVVPAEVRQAA